MRSSPIRVTQPDVEALKLEEVEAHFRKHFGEDFKAHRSVGFMTAASEDNAMFGLIFFRPDGTSTKVSLDRELILDLAGCLAVTWQQMSDRALIKGPAAGKA